MPLVQAPYPPGSGAVGALVPTRHFSGDTLAPDGFPDNDHWEGDASNGQGAEGEIVPSRETVPPAISAQYPRLELSPQPSREAAPPAITAQFPAGLFPSGSTQPSRETIPPAIGSGALTYAQQVAADGAVAYWRLGESVGAGVAVDSIAGNNGTVQLPVVFGQPGAVTGNTAASFSGAGKILIGANVAMPHAGFSLEAWVNYPSAAGASLPILATDTYLDGGYAWQIRGSNQTTIVFADPIGGTAYGQILMTLGAWHHVVTTYDGTTVRHYVDGVADFATPLNLSLISGTSAPPQIACSFRDATFFAGTLDEIAIYQRCLTPAQILAHFNAR